MIKTRFDPRIDKKFKKKDLTQEMLKDFEYYTNSSFEERNKKNQGTMYIIFNQTSLISFQILKYLFHSRKHFHLNLQIKCPSD